MEQQIGANFGVKTGQPEHGFYWKTDSSVQKLLDVIIHILANEYIWTIRENPTLFKEIASGPSAPRNDDGKAPFNGGFKPHYLAHTKIQTLALLDEEHKGSNWYVWRTRYVPIRTASEITAHIVIPVNKQAILYKIYAHKAKQLCRCMPAYPSADLRMSM